MRYQKLNIFPTVILKFDMSDIFDTNEINLMTNDVDYICTNNDLMQIGERTPKHQSRPILFDKRSPQHWQKLNANFLECCKFYLETVENFVHNQDKLEFTHTRAWFYKSWDGVSSEIPSPWHTHSPSFLSGVFYLKLPPDDNSCGTEFHDPRWPESQVERFEAVLPTELCWVIFPGWLSHRAHRTHSLQPRYTIAADSYVKVL